MLEKMGIVASAIMQLLGEKR